MATEDARYLTSSQYRLWSFSPDGLANLRAKTNALAVAQISARLQTSDPPEFLTPEEEALLLRFHTVELLQASTFCEQPTDVRATAAVFFRRFYVTNSIMTYPARDLMKTCLFFAAKAEGYFGVKLAWLAAKLQGATAEGILAGEYLLCQGLRFAFDVRHSFRALDGAILDLRRIEAAQLSRIDNAHGRARDILKFSPLMTDAYFHYTPSQIMFAALSMADKGLADQLLKERLPENGEPSSTQMHDKITATIASCRAMLEEEPPSRFTEYWGTTSAAQAVRPLLKKWKKCHDPDREDLVALQRTRREQATRKEAPSEPSVNDGSVFG